MIDRVQWAMRVMDLAMAARMAHPQLAAVLMIVAKATDTGDLDLLAPVLRVFVDAMVAKERGGR